MADDTFSVTNFTPFHPADTPRGTLYYNLDELTSSQQSKLNDLKIDTIREDHKYLAKNPEIRAIIALLLRKLMRHRPIIKIHEFIARFFSRSSADIQEEILEYLDQRETKSIKEKLSIKEESEEYIEVTQKAPEKKEISIEQSLDIICSEECTCPHSVGWKLHSYIPFDDMSFKETEHWLTPKTSKTSFVGDQSSFGMSSGDMSMSELAQVIDLVGGDDEEGTEAPLSDVIDEMYGELVTEHILVHQDSSEQGIQAVADTEEQDKPEENEHSPSHEQEADE
ncbi:hypothetical protein WA026_006825 [Henosepilachna vigintioctopunctata]|uniref:Uncharacterized protein n=1 Tax=Henosepilachna vigintioctopunctata TaxID=420089 RepID=A0AAW1UF46_9CUCU